MRVAVLGAAGYVGGELLRILLAHPEVDDVVAASRSLGGRALADAHPALAALCGDRAFTAEPPARAAAGCDVVFLTLEHGAAAGGALAAALECDPRLVVDLSADYRLADPDLHARHYGARAAAPPRPFRYALADVLGESLRGATALAVPGCFATAAQLALRPLAGAPLAAPPALFAITGSSGGGREPRAAAHHPVRAHNLYAYGVFSHRHEAEVEERWREWAPGAAPPRLMVHAGPFVRGIHLTLHARLDGGAEDAAAAYAETYRGRPFVRVLDKAPELGWVVGTNVALVQAVAGPDGREIQVMVAIDNLVKGAAGQAVQAMNLALGLPEDAGLRLGAPWPA